MRVGNLVERRKEPVVVSEEREYRLMGIRWKHLGAYQRGDNISAPAKAAVMYRMREGDFVFNRIDTDKGAFALVGADLDGALASNEFPAYRAHGDVLLSEYLWLYFQRDSVYRELRGAGSEGRARWKEADFESQWLALPSLPEQRRIVDLIAAVDNVVQQADRAENAVMAAWDAAAVAMAQAFADSPTVRLADIAEITGGLTKNKREMDQPGLVEVPYLRVANVHRNRLDLSDVTTIRTTATKATSLTLHPGDLLLNEGGDLDKLGRGTVWQGEIPGCIHQNHVFRARLITEDFDPWFVSYWANSFGRRWFETFGTKTTGIASVSKTTLSTFPVPNVNIAVQKEWVTTLGSLLRTASGHADLRSAAFDMRSKLLGTLLSGEHAIPESYDELIEEVA